MKSKILKRVGKKHKTVDMDFHGLTIITSELLMKKGFKKQEIEGITFKKDGTELHCDYNVWVLDTFKFVQPLQTNT